MSSADIAIQQERREREIQQKYDTSPGSDAALLRQKETDAAKSIQRTYRGYRIRRELNGLSLDPASRWTEAIKEAQYRQLITRAATGGNRIEGPAEDINPKFPRRSSTARSNWSFAGRVARRANADEESSLSDTSSESLPDHDKTSAANKAKAARKSQKLAAKQDRIKSAKMMDLSYFLEMVDVKHRYGSNLRKYHAEWKSRPTHENFFYWLDCGDGKDLDLPKCTRERLDRMSVRYLGREERRLYEVIVGEKGKLVWRKDGQRVDTSPKWRDSLHGIVDVDDPAPKWADRPIFARGSSESSGMGSDNDLEPEPTVAEPDPPETEQIEAKRTTSILEKLPGSLGGPKKEKGPKQKWIFVADIKNNLYIGIKQPGAFQHSSFLHGSRVSVAGLINVRDGQLRILEPRSGHYRTPSHNLHIFIKSLKSRGVDMSATAVGGSYAAMIGIEGYMKTKGKWNRIQDKFKGMMSNTGKIDEKDEKSQKGEENDAKQPTESMLEAR